MATPGDLITKTAELTGASRAFVQEHQRYLRDACLMTRGGRGRSAPRMTHGDALNLWLSLVCSPVAKEGPERVQHYSRLVAHNAGGAERFMVNVQRLERLDTVLLAFMEATDPEAVSSSIRLVVRVDDMTAQLRSGPEEVAFNVHADDLFNRRPAAMKGIRRHVTADLSSLAELARFVDG